VPAIPTAAITTVASSGNSLLTGHGLVDGPVAAGRIIGPACSRCRCQCASLTTLATIGKIYSRAGHLALTGRAAVLLRCGNGGARGMTDYVIAAVLFVFIVTVLVVLKRRERR
jgi:hypothetical protein